MDSILNQPVKLCECGCGQSTPIVTHTNAAKGYIKGQYCRFAPGHSDRRGSPEKRFWQKVDRSGGPSTCWLWTGTISSTGYGDFHWPGGTKAHRFAYSLTFGPIPDGLLVCHSCDVTLCVNPAHLFLGTHKDNSRDMTAKGRGPRGERNGIARLTDADVQEIRTIAKIRGSGRKLADEYGVSTSTISTIRSGERWKHIR